MSQLIARNKKNLRKYNFDLTIGMLDAMISYVLSSNQAVSRRSLLKMRNLFDLLDDSIYQNDRQMEVRIFLIKKLLCSRLEKRIADYNLLVESVLTGGQYDDEICEILNELLQYEDLNDEDIYYIDEYVSDRLQFGFIYQYEEELDNHLLRLKSGDYNSLAEFNKSFESVICSLYNSMKKAKAESRYSVMDFGTDEESLDCAISQTIDELNQETNIIKTGIKMLNKMLSGGFQAGRTYLFLGMAKGWKSGMLLNTALWAKHCNNISPKDPTKIPCVLYVTQENSRNETLERIWSYYFGEEKNIKDYDPETALRMLQEAGFNEEGTAIKIKYRPNKSISTADLDAMIDELALEGYEVIMLVHDYVKRIRSVDRHPDLRLELGAIIDEFTVISKTRNIPLVTASQLNREAFRIVEASDGKKANLAKQLGASHAGESMLMIENADYAFVMAKEMRKSTENEYLTIKMIASRGKDNNINYFAHPFENGMRLKEDYNLAKSLSLFDLGDDLINFDPNNPRGKKSNEGDEPQITRRRKPRVRPDLSSKTEGDGETSLLNNMQITL